MGICSTKINSSSLQYSVEVGEAQPNGTKELRNPFCPKNCLENSREEPQTLQDYYIKSFLQFSERPCLGSRFGKSYKWKTYKQIQECTISFGAGLLELGLCPVQEDEDHLQVLGVFSKNREEWLIADIGCALFGIATVPLYETLGISSILLILDQTNMKTILLSQDKLELILKLKSQGFAKSLENIISMDFVNEELMEEFRHFHMRLFPFQAILASGQLNIRALESFTSNKIFTITYTCGTTGNPKGVVATHKNFISAIEGAMDFFKPLPSDVHISYLPLAHVYERISSAIILVCGGSIGFYSNDTYTIKEDLELLQPTILACVPRLLSRFYDLVKEQLETLTGFKARMAQRAIKAKLDALIEDAAVTHPFYDSFVFADLKKLLGGRVRMAVTASAPISPEVLNFLKVCFCCQILEAYGQTETTGPATMTYVQDNESGHVGGPIRSLSMKLVDIPEMNYTKKSISENLELAPSGEICFKGPNVMSGYFKNKEATLEAIDSDGWLHTGDVGLLRANGSLKIIDRKKNIFKLSQGEYVAPEKIENVYAKSKFVALVFVHGDSLENYIIAIIFPKRSVLEPFLKSSGLDGSWNEMCSHQRTHEIMLEELVALGKKAGLYGFEQAKKIYIHPDAISPESGLITETLKIKRYNMRMHFKKTIENLYSS